MKCEMNFLGSTDVSGSAKLCHVLGTSISGLSTIDCPLPDIPDFDLDLMQLGFSVLSADACMHYEVAM